MGYKKLYNFCQNQGLHVRRNIIRDEVLNITGINKVAVMKTSMDVSICRGFYVSAKNKDHPLIQQFGSHLIVLARDENKCWDRFVFTKELMHIFDNPLKSTNSGDAFDRLLTDLTAPHPLEWSPQMVSEVDCFWMALGVLCPENERQELQKKLEAGQIDDYGIALKLKIPKQYVHHLFRRDFGKIIKKLLVPIT